MYAVIETGGKQYRVAQGDTIFIEKLDVQPDEKVVFERVVVVAKENKLTVGTPYVKGAQVNAVAVKNGKGKKITVFTYKPKKSSARKLGHRQAYTQVKIESINV